MAKFNGYTCSECNVVRGPANHWLLTNLRHGRIEVLPWDEQIAATETDILHLCGEGCAAKVLSRQVSAWRAA